MRNKMLFLLLAVICVHLSCKEEPDPQNRKVQNLRAFSKLYGYTRYFHPSDEAASINWDKFIYYGVQEVLNAQNSKELKATLQELFLPIAPTMEIYLEGETPKKNELPKKSNDNVLVTWQHKGLGGISRNPAYKSMRIGRPSGSKNTEQDSLLNNLFEQHAKENELIVKNIGDGIFCRFPVALYLDKIESQKFSNDFEDLNGKLNQIQLEKNAAQKEETRIGAVITAWNIFQHFYPYFDVIETDWDTVLTKSLSKVLEDKDEIDCMNTLKSMIYQLHDGHGFVWHPVIGNAKSLPVLFEYIDNKIVVVETANNLLKRGDILLEVDGNQAKNMLFEEEKSWSGTPQHRMNQALRYFTYKNDTIVSKLKIQRDGSILNISVDRKSPFPEYSTPESLTKMDNGIYYIDLAKSTLEDMNDQINEMSKAKGIIFDVRGYPKNSHEIIGHMIDEPVLSLKWNIPQIIYPDQENLVGYDTSGRWVIQPKKPKFQGKTVFLTNENAISYSESYLGIIKHYKLAEIIGSSTAGANGNTNPFSTIGGFYLSWTGMKVLKQDGSQHHLIGVEPTIVVEPTMQGIRKGEDEVLEKAIEEILKE